MRSLNLQSAMLSIVILGIYSEKDHYNLNIADFGTGNFKNCLWRFKPNGGRLALLTTCSYMYNLE